MLFLTSLMPNFGWIPEYGWMERTQVFLSQPPPWSSNALMIACLVLILLLLLAQWRASRKLDKKRRRNGMVQFIKFKMLGQTRAQYIKALAEYAITDHFEDAYHDGLITYQEKCDAYEMFANRKPHLTGLVPRKQDKLTWRARNELLSYLMSLKAARESKPSKPLPLPEPKKIRVKGNGKLAELAHRALK